MAARVKEERSSGAAADFPDIAPPSSSLLLLETRVLVELSTFLLHSLSVRDLPRGDGHAVMVLPGFGTNDLVTWPLRHALARLGYAVLGWGQGRNLGMRPHIRQALTLKLQKLHAHQGRVSLVGWSLGGVFAREMARHQPALVRHVYTLGSPFNGRPDANNMQALFRLANRGRAIEVDRDGFRKRQRPPPVPCTAIHTRSDGIVAWRCCLEDPAPGTCNIEVRGSHFGLVFNPQVLRVLAEGLSQTDDAEIRFAAAFT